MWLSILLAKRKIYILGIRKDYNCFNEIIENLIKLEMNLKLKVGMKNNIFFTIFYWLSKN
jgi:hypothetical protein